MRATGAFKIASARPTASWDLRILAEATGSSNASGKALLALDLVAIAADDRPQSGRGPTGGLASMIGRQVLLFGDLPHWAWMFRWRSGGVTGYCR